MRPRRPADRYNRAKAEEQEREDKRRYEIEMQLDQQRYGESIARARAADEFERQRYTERRGDMAPYRAQGVQALQQLGALANIHIAPSGAPEQPPASAATMAQLADMRAGR